MNRVFFLGLCLGLLAAVLGCGYTLVGQGSLPDHIKTVAIPTFKNDTIEEGIEEVVTQAVIEEYIRGGKVLPASEVEADAVLLGTIRSYNPEEAVTYNELNEVSSYKLTVTVDLELKDLVNDETIWKREGLAEDADFAGGPDVDITTEEDNEDEALEQLAEELAQRIQALSTEGF